MNFIKFNDQLINFELVASIRPVVNHRKGHYGIQLYNQENNLIEEAVFPDHKTMDEYYAHLKDGLITLSLS